MSPSMKFGHARELEDALVYLPRKSVVEFRRSQPIYDEHTPSQGIYLIVKGRVKVIRTAEDGTQTVIGIFVTDQFFGALGLLGPTREAERAIALEHAALMVWTADEIEEHIERQPRLGVALMQVLVGRCLDCSERLLSMATDKTPERVALTLLRFARRQSLQNIEDGSVRIAPMTHQLISEYVGTSREIVTFQMNQLRHQGLIRYSRKGIDVFADALQAHLHKRDLSL